MEQRGLLEKVKLREVIKEGNPREVLVSTAEIEHVDVVVVGTRYVFSFFFYIFNFLYMITPTDMRNLPRCCSR